MNSNSQIVCIDEYGDSNLEILKDGVSEYFILTAVIIDEENYSVETEKAVDIISKYFPTGELKSSSIGNNFKRRIEILKEISELNFHYYSIVFEKGSIKKDSGLNNKKSFIKHLNQQLYEIVYNSFSNLTIYADEHGHPEFMVSFENYILNILKDDFFIKRSFNFVDSNNYPFVQIADLISGSLARIFDSKKLQDKNGKILNILKQKTLRIDEWPIKYNIKPGFPITANNQIKDPTIISHSIRQAEIFISKNEKKKDPDIELQVCTIKYLLFHFKFIDPTVSISTNSIIDHILEAKKRKIDSTAVRMNIISKLRDNFVLISSSSNGYKIPLNLSDLHNYVDRTNSMIFPMLDRVKKARDQIKMVSKNGIDILSDPKYVKLNEILK